MKFKTKLLSGLLAAAMLVGSVGVVGPIGGFFASAATDTAGPGTLSFNLRAVNLLSGADTVDSSSELTIQYTDASLGDGLEMYVSIATTDGTLLVEKQRVESASLRVEDTKVYREGEYGGTGNMPVYSNMAGSVTFKPALDAAYSVSDLTVTVWIENSANSAEFSNRATTTINNGFANGVPSGITGSNWMNYIDGSTLLSQINMPGAHDAATQYIASVLININQCQDKDIGTLLSYGVRYLDIRGDTKNTSKEGTVNGKTVQDFGLSHSSFAAKYGSKNGRNLLFSDVYTWCKDFLTANPSETIFMTVYNENCNSREELMNKLFTFIDADPSLFYTKSNEIPTLDDVRGKIVMVRRFPSGFGDAVNFAGDNGFMDFFWEDKSTGATPQPVVPISSNLKKAVTTYFVQDNYGLNANDKWTAAKNFLGTAASNKQANQYYINFFSTAPNALTTPSSSSGTVNKNFNNGNGMTQGNQYGYLIFDFITAAIAKTVYETNIFTAEPQVQKGHNNEKTDKVVLHYDFAGIVNGRVPDTTGNGFDGTLKNTGNLSVNSDYNTLTFNNAGKSANDGAGYVDIPQSVFRGTGDTVTIQVWLKETGSQSTNTWFSMGTGHETAAFNRNFLVANTKWDGNPGPRFSVDTTKVGKNGHELKTETQNAISQNEWHLFTYVLDGDTLKIYVDSVEQPIVLGGKVNANFNDLTGSMADTPIRLGTASYWTGDVSFEGTMGDFTIYNYAVGADEIAEKYSELAAAPALTDVSVDTFVVSDSTVIDEAKSTVTLKIAKDLDLTAVKTTIAFKGMKAQLAADGSNFADLPEDGVLDLSKTPAIRVIGYGENAKVYKIVIERFDPVIKPPSAEDVSAYLQIKTNGDDASLKDFRILIEAPADFLRGYDEAVLTVTFTDASGKTYPELKVRTLKAYTSVYANGEEVFANEDCAFIGVVITKIPDDIKLVGGEITFTVNGEPTTIALGSAKIR